VFITLEGPDGAGKSLQAATLAERLRASGRPVVLTREPGGTAIGERLREVLLGVSAPQRDPLTEAMLFSTARHQLVVEVIEPALADGAIVVCDRYVDSTTAYQGHGGGAPLEQLAALAAVATGGLLPDRTVLLDVPVEIGLARRRVGEATGITRFEVGDDYDRAYHERVRRAYLDMARADAGRWRVVDAAADASRVADQVWSAVVDLLAEG
jgi:dTMP kinase